MPAGNDTAYHDAFKSSVESQYGEYQNAEELVRAHQTGADPAVRRASLTQIDVEATDALRKKGLGDVEKKFKDVPDGWLLETFAVRGNAIVGVFVDEQGLYHKLVTGANDRYAEARLTPGEATDRAAAARDRRVALETARLRAEADERIAEARAEEEARIQKELEKIRKNADAELEKAQTAARKEQEKGSSKPSGSGSSGSGGSGSGSGGAGAGSEAKT